MSLHEVDDLGLVSGLGQGACKANPIQQLLLPRFLDLVEGEVGPQVLVAVPELFEAGEIGVIVGPEEVVLGGEEGVRPAG